MLRGEKRRIGNAQWMERLKIPMSEENEDEQLREDQEVMFNKLVKQIRRAINTRARYIDTVPIWISDYDKCFESVLETICNDLLTEYRVSIVMRYNEPVVQYKVDHKIQWADATYIIIHMVK